MPTPLMFFSLALPLWAGLFLVALSAHGQIYRITVEAGNQARESTIASFALPGPGSDWRLADASGRAVPLQLGADGEASFIVRDLEAGTAREFRLERGPPPAPAEGIRVERQGGELVVARGERTLFKFHVEPSAPPSPEIRDVFRRAGYLHPVYSPSGILVTNDYPSDHYHHHGIWWAWTNTEYEGRTPDFWNVGQGSGRVDLVALDQFWSGPVHGGFQARLRSVDRTAEPEKTALRETWTVRAYALGEGEDAYWLFDLESAQRVEGESPIRFPQYRYGGIGVRGHASWGDGDSTRFLTASGETDRLKGNQERAAWCHMGGYVDGAFTGIGILAHPGNFRFPEPMRLNPRYPFFNFAPSQVADWEMSPGQTLIWRYRFVVHDGYPDRERLDAFWRDYAVPVHVTVQPIDR